MNIKSTYLWTVSRWRGSQQSNYWEPSYTRILNGTVTFFEKFLSVMPLYRPSKKLKNFTPFHIRKQLAESLVLSALDYNDVICHPAPEYLIKRLQRVQLAAAGFVVNHYANISDILKLGWLPVKYRREFHMTKLIFKALYLSDWHLYLPMQVYKPGRSEFRLVTRLLIRRSNTRHRKYLTAFELKLGCAIRPVRGRFV